MTYTGRYATYNASTRYLSTFSTKQTNARKTAATATLLTTGASNTTKAYNLYDVAGNVWEWTDETSFDRGNTSTQCKEIRGGSYIIASYTDPACCRYGATYDTLTHCTVGFRVVLYIK